MTRRIAVANRKGGVGKSTLTMALATVLAEREGKRVLVVDLDTQCNVSQALIGGERWAQLRREERLISDYFFSILDNDSDRLKDRAQFVAENVGEVQCGDGMVALLPGSLQFEDVQQEYTLKQFKSATTPGEAAAQVQGPIRQSLKRLDRKFDAVFYDCPPGLSLASLAVLELADHVVVPFKPDFISEFGVERIAMLIQGVRHPDALQEIPMHARRYTCLANGVVSEADDPRRDRDRFIVDTIAGDHPTFETLVPLDNDIRDAVDWMGQSLSLRDKFGTGLAPFLAIHDELWRERAALQEAA
ncbi:MAG: ParA family protein [Pseudomonadota bacterium]